ncbi:MAG: ABC transporter permease subunit [Chloroflexota bacterium]
MPNKRNWVPYLLIFPTLIYLVFFFAYPMVRGLILAVYDDEANLALMSESSMDAPVADLIPQSASIEILGRQGNLVSEEDLGENNVLTEIWFFIEAPDADGNAVSGWASESRIRVREEADDGTPVMGTVRRKLGSNADPLTSVFAEPNENSEVVGKLEANTEAQIADQNVLEVWFLVRGENNGEMVEGWAPSRFLQIFEDEVTGRIDRGNSGEFTTEFLERMANDRFFWPAIRSTALLLILIIPTQFVLAIVMSLVIQAQLKYNSFILYIFAVPLGVSDLAAGILWFAIFTQNGLLNSFLQTVGLIETSSAWLTADTRNWILVAIWLAEVWRATSIVMVIVVSGLQAISSEVLEAAEIFGATFWQRLRYVILPLLRPSLQVALILRTILAFQVFAVVIALSGGDVVTVLANETFRQYFDLRNSNVAAAYALLILVISMATAVAYLRAIRTQEEVQAA